MKLKTHDKKESQTVILGRVARAGFSLVEINLALLIVGVGLVSLLSLFPVGLRQSGLATGDSVQAVFADRLLNTLQAEADQITDWSKWHNFPAEVLKKVKLDNVSIKKDEEIKFKDYLGVEDNTVRYKLKIEQVEPDLFKRRLWRASLQVSERAEGDLSRAHVYCTDFVFMQPLIQ